MHFFLFSSYLPRILAVHGVDICLEGLTVLHRTCCCQVMLILSTLAMASDNQWQAMHTGRIKSGLAWSGCVQRRSCWSETLPFWDDGFPASIGTHVFVWRKQACLRRESSLLWGNEPFNSGCSGCQVLSILWSVICNVRMSEFDRFGACYTEWCRTRLPYWRHEALREVLAGSYHEEPISHSVAQKTINWKNHQLQQMYIVHYPSRIRSHLVAHTFCNCLLNCKIVELILKLSIVPVLPSFAPDFYHLLAVTLLCMISQPDQLFGALSGEPQEAFEGPTCTFLILHPLMFPLKLENTADSPI